MKRIYGLLGALLLSSCSPSSKPADSLSETISIQQEALVLLSSSSQVIGDGHFGMVHAREMRTFKVINKGSGPSEVATVSLSYTDSSYYSIVYKSGCDRSLQPNEYCIVRVAFDYEESYPSTYYADLNVGSKVIGLFAETQAEDPIPLSLSVSENNAAVSALNFGTINSRAAISKILKIKNTGGQKSGLLSLSLSNSEFTLASNTCAKELNPNESCSLKLVLNPAVGHGGSKSADLVIHSALPDTSDVVIPVNAQVALIQATGPAQGVTLRAYDGAVAFTTLDLGNLSSSAGVNKILQIKNEGSSSSASLRLVMFGGQAASFSLLSNGCDGKILTASATCSVRLVFSALGKAPGTYESNLTMGDLSIPVSVVVQGSVALPPSEPIDNDTLVLLHFDNNIQDSSIYARTFNFSSSSSSPEFVSGKFGPAYKNTDYLVHTTSNDFDFSSSDFTFEAWIKYGPGESGVIVSEGVTFNPNGYFFAADGGLDGNGGLVFFVLDGSDYTLRGFAPIADNQYHHVALVRRNHYFELYADGIRIAQDSNFYRSLPFQSGNPFTIGSIYMGANDPVSSVAKGQGAFFQNGLIDEVRISKVARWSNNFTPPNVYLSASEALTMNLPFDSNLNDLSIFNQTVSAEGSAAISTSWSKVGGGSLALDGNGYVSIENSSQLDISSGNFTIDFWFYLSDLSTYRSLLSASVINHFGFQTTPVGVNGASTPRMGYYASSSGSSYNLLSGEGGPNNAQGSIPLQTNTWYHCALVRNGNTYTGYINGQVDFSAVVPGNILLTGDDFRVGAWGSLGSTSFPQYNAQGFIDEVRFSKSVRFSGPFTP